eukprot:scaffold224932_cov89-Cyclotella_meneghiniana.AAC.1
MDLTSPVTLKYLGRTTNWTRMCCTEHQHQMNIKMKTTNHYDDKNDDSVDRSIQSQSTLHILQGGQGCPGR